MEITLKTLFGSIIVELHNKQVNHICDMLGETRSLQVSVRFDPSNDIYSITDQLERKLRNADSGQTQGLPGTTEYV